MNEPTLDNASPGREKLRIAIVAGEASGDILGAGLLKALRNHVDELEVEGIGGPLMQAQGCHSLFPMEKLSVMGLVEVLKHLRELLAIRKSLIERWRAKPPDVFIGIDSPDFTLTLEEKLHQAGTRTLHYVSPSVWAWRQRRVLKIKRAVNRILTLFPFEETFYQQHEVPVTCVGHPLADEIPLEPDQQSARQQLGLNEQDTVIALLPGSRIGEVSRLAETFIKTAQWLLVHRPDLRFLVPFANETTQSAFKDELAKHGGMNEITTMLGDSRTAMAASDVVLLASGTAALEAMLLKKPMVVCYRLHPFTYRILKYLVTVQHYSIPNLLAGKSLVPEFIQDEATPAALGAAVMNYLVEQQLVAELRQSYTELHLQLKRNANEKAALAVLNVVPT